MYINTITCFVVTLPCHCIFIIFEFCFCCVDPICKPPSLSMSPMASVLSLSLSLSLSLEGWQQKGNAKQNNAYIFVRYSRCVASEVSSLQSDPLHTHTHTHTNTHTYTLDENRVSSSLESLLLLLLPFLLSFPVNPSISLSLKIQTVHRVCVCARACVGVCVCVGAVVGV